MGQEYTRQLEIRSLTPASGGVLFYDDFSSGLKKWNVDATPGDGDDMIDTDRSHDGSASLRIRTTNNPPVIGDFVIANRIEPTGISTNLELSVFFFASEIDTQPDFRMTIEFFGKPRHRIFSIEYDVDNTRFNHRNDAGAFVATPGGDLIVNPNEWHKLTLRVDNLNGEYISLIIDGQVVDMSGIDGDDIGAEVDTAVSIDLVILVNAIVDEEIFLDQVLLQEL